VQLQLCVHESWCGSAIEYWKSISACSSKPLKAISVQSYQLRHADAAHTSSLLLHVKYALARMCCLVRYSKHHAALLMISAVAAMALIAATVNRAGTSSVSQEA
jgi:hypothetical protein